MSDVVERLNAAYAWVMDDGGRPALSLLREAAAEITALRDKLASAIKERDEAREKVEEADRIANWATDPAECAEPDEADDGSICPTEEAIRRDKRARSVLSDIRKARE